MLKLTRTPFVFLFFIFFFTQFLLTSCDTTQSRAKKIVSLRSERKLLLDKLYQEYGGSELAQSINNSVQNEANSGNNANKQVAQGIAGIAQNLDQSVFEEKILSLGKGENLLLLSEKSKKYFSRSNVIDKAKKVYEITLELEALENSQQR